MGRDFGQSLTAPGHRERFHTSCPSAHGAAQEHQVRGNGGLRGLRGLRGISALLGALSTKGSW